MKLGWRQLVSTERLVSRRRRPVLRPALVAPVIGGVSALGLHASATVDAELYWLLAAVGAAALVVMGAPFRMFWRPDAGLLGRLPIAGRELYRLETWRALGAAWPSGIAVAIGAFGLHLPALALARHVAFVLALQLAATVLAPAIGALAGAIVVSSKARGLVTGLTGGYATPGTIWLSFLPGLGGLGLARLGWMGAGWLREGNVATAAPLAAAVLGALALLFALEPLARRFLGTATREIAALDAVRLAHVDLTAARGLEKQWGRMLLAGPARLVYEKDVALMRRRHPGFYLVTGLGVLTLGIVSVAAAAPMRERVVCAGAVALGGYVLLLARRLTVAPTELPRLITTLPLPETTIWRAKWAHVAWRVLWATATSGAIALIRSPAPAHLGLLLGAICATTVLIAGAIVRRIPQ